MADNNSLLLLLLATSIPSPKSSFYPNTTFIRSVLQNQWINFYQNQKKDQQDDLSFACLQFTLNHLNILAHNMCFHNQVKNQ